MLKKINLPIQSLLTLFVLLISLLPRPSHADESVIDICYNLNEPEVHVDGSGSFSGFWPSYLTKLLAPTDYEYRFVQSTHQRCQTEALADNPAVDVILGRVFTEQRSQDYYTIPIYQQVTIIFYNQKKFPDGIPDPSSNGIVDTIGGLKNINVCGFHGWTYDYYYTVGFPKSWRPLLIAESNTEDRFLRALALIKAERCDAIEMPANTFTDGRNLYNAFDGIGCFPTIKDTTDIINIMLTKNASYSERMAASLFQSATILSQKREVESLLENEITARLPQDLPENIQKCMNQTIFGLHHRLP